MGVIGPRNVFPGLAVALDGPDANPLVAEPETDFNAKWPFNVIHFGIIEEPLRGYIA